MKKNMGSIDRIIRIMIVLVIATLYFLNMIGGTVAVILLAVAGIFLATSAAGFCPLYKVFGLSTDKTQA